MVSITLSVPEEIKHGMESFSEINWSGFVRKSIEQKVKELSWKEEMLKKLEKERDITKWSVKLQRESREDRFNELKRKRLI